MKLRSFAWLVLAALPGCNGCPKEDRVSKTETVKCTHKTYHAPQHGSGTTLGMTSGGKLVTGTTSVNIAEAFGTVFECQHGSFVTNRKSIWEKTREGETYHCDYEEVYDQYEDGRREFKGLDLIDVYKHEG